MDPCPVCRQPRTANPCPECGFDPSCGFETYPTLAPLPRHMDAVSRLKSSWQAEQAMRFRCPDCGGYTFTFLKEELRLQCTQCRRFEPIVLPQRDRIPPRRIPRHPTPPAHTHETEEPVKQSPYSFLKQSPAAATDYGTTVILRSNGTVVSVGPDAFGMTQTQNWYNTVAIATSDCHTVGLQRNGTVTAVGRNEHGECNVQGWRNIQTIAASKGFTVGLHRDGTVVAIGKNDYGQCDTQNWHNVTAIATGENFTAALHKYGGVFSTMKNAKSQKIIRNWKNIVAIAAGSHFLAGLCQDGTVVAVGDAGQEDHNVKDWNSITAIAAGKNHIVGLKAKGTVCSTPLSGFMVHQNEHRWTEITAIAAGDNFSVGLRRDGSVVATGDNGERQLSARQWTNIASIHTAPFSKHIVGVQKDGKFISTRKFDMESTAFLILNG